MRDGDRNNGNYVGLHRVARWKSRDCVLLGLLKLGSILVATDAAIPISFASHFCVPKRTRSFRQFGVKERLFINVFKSKSERDSLKLASTSIPGRLVDTLDLSILVEGISRYTGSRRGRQALLLLVNENFDDSQTKIGRFDDIPAKRRRVSSTFRAPVRFSSGTSRESDIHASPMAQSAEEARNEFQLVEQAMRCLQQSDGLNYPEAIYGNDSSPWDTQKIATTDYDDWLTFPSKEEWSLEHILQADQVIGTLLQLYEWSNLALTLSLCPGLAEIGQRIRMADLKLAHAEITGAVEISRVRTYNDPNGRSTYTFRLGERKFPLLQSLELKELELLSRIDTTMSGIMRKQRGAPESLDYQQRRVLAVVQSSISPDFGIVRGMSENRDRLYVEPHQLVDLNDQLAKVRQELAVSEQQIKYDLIQSVLRVADMIDAGLDSLARLDVIFAKAAFASDFNGVIPTVQEDGRIEVRRYVHPVLAIRNGKESTSSVVPIDLHLTADQGSRALIISGPNGGGKTVALKAFGVATILVKLAIPVPVTVSTNFIPRIDFFDDVLVEVGDGQSVTEGESTLMSRLNACARLINRVTDPLEVNGRHHDRTLVLLDELGGGTDPTAGAALAQAILERLLQSSKCHLVATTHSPQLKALSYESRDFNCASVLLKSDGETSSQLPTYQLEYGIIGDSYALSAASRCTPPLPDGVLSRAAELMATLTSSSSDINGDYLRALSDSLEKQLESATNAAVNSEQAVQDIMSIRKAMISLASSYDQHLRILEQRLEHCYQELRGDPEGNAFELVGNSLAEVAVIRKKVKSQEELLRDKGLRLVPENYKLSVGESVVIVGGDLDGTVAKVAAETTVQNLEPGSVVVLPSLEAWDLVSPGSDGAMGPDTVKPVVLQRRQVAIWDFGSLWEGDDKDDLAQQTSVKDKRLRLSMLLSNLNSVAPSSTRRSQAKPSNSFKSSRERKAAAKVNKKGGKSK